MLKTILVPSGVAILSNVTLLAIFVRLLDLVLGSRYLVFN
jgi:hypothetical protein